MVDCNCVQDYRDLPASTIISGQPCIPCEDSDPEDPTECGNAFGAYSVYFVQQDDERRPDNHGFSYWQCVGSELYNPVDEVMPEQLYRL